MTEPKPLDLTDHGMTIPYESTPEQYRRAKAIAKEAGQTLTILPPAPKPWQPPEGSFCIRDDVARDTEQYQAAKKAAEAAGLLLVIAPSGWSGPTTSSTKTDEAWVPPKGAVIVRHDANFAEWTRACEAAERFGVWPPVLAPENVPLPAKLPEKILPGMPIVLTKAQARDTQLYRQKKAEAEKFGVSFSVID